eukprot:8418515-Alexandrium_andersonii.AAC.1
MCIRDRFSTGVVAGLVQEGRGGDRAGPAAAARGAPAWARVSRPRSSASSPAAYHPYHGEGPLPLAVRDQSPAPRHGHSEDRVLQRPAAT